VWWPALARNKKSVTLDLRQPAGQALARELIATADVVLENMRPGTMERWGLGYDVLSATNPGLVMIRVTGFGQDGPYAARPGYGSIGEAMGGLRAVMGEPDRQPSRAGISIGDSLAASFAFMGGLMAIHLRRVQPALLRYGAWTAVAVLVAMAAVLIQFVVSVRWLHKPLDYVTAPIQPLVLVYSIAVILCLCWLAMRWEARREPGGVPPGYPAFKQLSDASFGVYLMHALVLRVVADHLLPALPAGMPGVLRVLIIWIVAAGGTAMISIALVHTPILSRLVGRARPLPQWRRAERPRATSA